MLSTNVKYFKDEYVIVKYLGFRIFQNIFTLTANMMHKKMTKNNNCTIPDILRYVQAKLTLTQICTSLNTSVIIVDNVEQA